MLFAAMILTGAGWLPAQDVLAAAEPTAKPRPPRASAAEPAPAPSPVPARAIAVAPSALVNAPSWRAFDPWSPTTLMSSRSRAYTAASRRFVEPAASAAAVEEPEGTEDIWSRTGHHLSGTSVEALRQLDWTNFLTRDDKSFTAEFGRNFTDRFAPMEHPQFRAAMDMSWTLPPRLDDPVREWIPLGPFETEYRNILLEKKAKSPIMSPAQDAIGETEVVHDLRRELNDGHDPFSVSARTLLGEPAEGSAPFGFGRVGLRGYAGKLLSDPANVLAVTYDYGPFDARIGGGSTTFSVGQQFGPFRVSARGTYDYSEGRAAPSITVSRPLGRQTSIHMVTGYSVDSFILPGNVPYFRDPRDERSLGIVFYLDARF